MNNKQKAFHSESLLFIIHLKGGIKIPNSKF